MNIVRIIIIILIVIFEIAALKQNIGGKTKMFKKFKKKDEKPIVMNLRFYHLTEGVIVIPNIAEVKFLPFDNFPCFVQYTDGTTEILFDYSLMDTEVL